MFLAFLVGLPALLLGLYAQWRVRSNFQKYSRVRTARGVTGAEVARALLDAEGLQGVAIEQSKGTLSDHYDPRGKVLRLSPEVYSQPSVAAAGVAAHEMGHALQDKRGYAPLQLRSAMVPSVRFGSSLGPLIFIAGVLIANFTGSQFGIQVAWLGVLLFAAVAAFTIVTLPVEFDASRRAKQLLVTQGILMPDEMSGVNKVLNAAALTYVAAAAQAVSQLLYYVLILVGGRRD